MANTDSHRHFLSIPHARQLLQSDPSFRLRIPHSRIVKTDSEDTLWAVTMTSPTTLPYMLSFYPEPSSATLSPIPEIMTLVQSGDGLDGHATVMHGGMVTTLMDEGAAILLNFNKERAHQAASAKGVAEASTVTGISSFTAEIKVKFKRPVRTPGVCLVRNGFTQDTGNAAYGMDELGESADGQGNWKTQKRKKSVIIKIWCTLEQWIPDPDSTEKDALKLVECASAEAIFVQPRVPKL